MNTRDNKNLGQSVVEIVMALAIFFIIISGILVLFFNSLDSSRQAIEISQAQGLAQEGLEAVRSVGYNNWDDLIDGSYDVESSSGYWQLTTPLSQTLLNKYSRQIDIASPMRSPEDCLLVEEDEFEDQDIKEVISSVTWEFKGQTKEVVYASYLSNWLEPNADCGAALCLDIDVSAANIDETKKEIRGITIGDNCSMDITIDKVILTWTKPGDIVDVKINGFSYWAKNGPGTPTGSQPSGTELDMVDFVLAGDTVYDIDRFRFDSKIDGSTVTITFIMTDGSEVFEVTTPEFIP